MQELPLISIITPCLNRAEFVAEAVESVLNQDYPNLEHIIMDGGSTDGTLEVLRRYPHLKVVSEPDQGLYDAINKGIGIAHGEIMGFLNTDDFYETDIFKSIVMQFEKSPDINAVVGGASVFFDDPIDGRQVYRKYAAIQPGDLLYRSTRGQSIFNSWFFRKQIFSQFGVFDISYKYGADRDFLIRLALHNISFVDIPRTICHYRAHPNSLTFQMKSYSETDMEFELLTLSEKYLHILDIHDHARQMFLIWHSQITSDQIITALKNLALGRAYRYARRGQSHNPDFLAILFERLVSRGRSFVIRHLIPNYSMGENSK